MMTTVQPWMVLSVAAILFLIGMCGLMVRRNILIIFMCIELMLNSVNMTFITYSRVHQNLGGQMSAFFIIVVAAAEAAIGLGLLIAMFRTLRSVDTDDIQMLRE